MNKPLTMKELTTEERLQVFMLYPNAEILLDDDKTYPVTGWNCPNQLRIIVADSQIVGVKASKCQLILKSLEEITEEDKKGLAEALNFEGHTADVFMEDGHVRCFLYFRGICVHEYDRLPFEAADYLRSKGYALPFNGLDLFNAGIAVRSAT